jgi:hypothetical protein
MIGDAIDSVEQILIEDEIRLDRTDVRTVLHHEVAVAEPIVERFLDELNYLVSICTA